ncbi:MAG TPA: hypothetical protein VGG48_01275 [Rhizomicrobium sp.]|jgi:hypothetical protein
MRAVLFSVLAGMLAVFTPAAAQAPAWQSYSYGDLGFSVSLPDKPTRADSSVDTPRGTVPSSFISTSEGTLIFGITTSDYTTANGGAPTDAELTAQNAMNGILKERTVLTVSSFNVPGGAGRDSISTASGLMVRTRVYYMVPHIYIVMAAVPASQSQDALTSGDAAVYFSSFKMLPK